jgi:hypothetical protein
VCTGESQLYGAPAQAIPRGQGRQEVTLRQASEREAQEKHLLHTTFTRVGNSLIRNPFRKN